LSSGLNKAAGHRLDDCYSIPGRDNFLAAVYVIMGRGLPPPNVCNLLDVLLSFGGDIFHLHLLTAWRRPFLERLNLFSQENMPYHEIVRYITVFTTARHLDPIIIFLLIINNI
jgi:hypothetical protein